MKLHLGSPLTLLAVTLLHIFSIQGIASVPSRVCKPADFGATGDGVRLDSEAVSRAVDECKAGGVVQFEPGKTYRLGEITVTGRGVQLDVPPSTTLLASAERAHYGARQAGWYLLHFHRCFGCGLTGGGAIQGPARHFVDNSTAPSTIRNWRDPSCRVRQQCRPRLVGVCESEDVAITDVSLRDSAFWTLHIRDSERVLVRGVNVYGDLHFPNNDGIDIDGSSHVTVLQSYIATADDALCVKATSGGAWAVRHVLVSNCTLQSRSAAVKLGSETRADMVNITFSHLTVLNSNRGLAIQLRDHGSIRDVAFRHVLLATRRYPGRWWGGGEPIYVTALPRWLGSRVGSITNISFTDIAADVHGAVVVLAGSPESLVRGVLLRDMRMMLGPVSAEDTANDAAVAAAAAIAAGAGRMAAAGGAARRQEDAGARGRRAARRAATHVEQPAAAATRERMMRGGAGAGWRLQLEVKLDLRPGPYGERAWLATAPVLAQFVHGLELRNVSFEVRAAAAVASASSGPAVPDVRELEGGGWYQELTQHTVQVEVAEQVDMRVAPSATIDSVPHALLTERTEAQQAWAPLSGAMRGHWWRAGGRLGLGRRTAWLLVATAVLVAGVAAALYVLSRREHGVLLPLPGGASGSKQA